MTPKGVAGGPNLIKFIPEEWKVRRRRRKRFRVNSRLIVIDRFGRVFGSCCRATLRRDRSLIVSNALATDW